ncbi:hypothetical protein CYY_003746 [Polysphondylium violaceum]|uniref:DUF4460 domain-containing protein n=1 Tax=Polysphondylium violaceum TaxID=133409 RepID=A0A8J4PWJ0_9MYCE|nr:hypothetical protein CYY_003746 [Polysphondylium violaceum]
MLRSLLKTFTPVNGLNRSLLLNRNVSFQSPKRYLSTETTASDNKPKLKHVLKRFYLMIHPDTLQHHPTEKSVNSHNMKVFMSIVDQYKKRPHPDPNSKPQIHNLSFYVPEKDSEGKNIPDRFKMVDIEMIQNCLNPNHIPGQLAKLFGLCALPTDFVTEIEQIDNIKQPSIEGSLKDFLLDNKRYVYHTLIESAKQKAELDTFVRRIKREHDINVVLTTSADSSNFTYQENYHALYHFSDIMSRWRPVVTGNASAEKILRSLRFNLDHSEVNYISPDPMIFLDRSSPENWESYLNNINWDQLRDEIQYEKEESKKRNAQFVKERSEFEKHLYELEKLFKFRSIQWNEHDDPSEDPNSYLPHNEQMTECYSFTTMLLKHKYEIQTLVKTKLKNQHKVRINVGITPNLHKSKSFIDFQGTLRVSTKITFQEFIDILVDQYASCVEAVKKVEVYEPMRDYAQVRLGLRELTTLTSFAYSHGTDKVFEAYKKLYDNADTLRELGLSGFTIIITDYYSVSKNGEIYLKWDFNVQDIIRQLSAPQTEGSNEINIEQQQQQSQSN